MKTITVKQCETIIDKLADKTLSWGCVVFRNDFQELCKIIAKSEGDGPEDVYHAVELDGYGNPPSEEGIERVKKVINL